MSVITVLGIAAGLAMDAFAVSIASGCIDRRLDMRSTLKIALFFGLFQAVMPIVGWMAGAHLRIYIERYDHWLAFGLLLFVGGKMLYESFKLGGEKKTFDPRSSYILLLLALATSIDALIIGFSLSFLKVAIVLPSAIIGIITFLFSFSGVYLGKRFGHLFENKIELVGGLILIGIGLKVLIEHLAH